jgi:membrane-associated phospholipid phosphatase
MNLRPFFRRLALGAAVGLLALVAYRSIQAVTAERAEIRAECWGWTQLPFATTWMWPYFSMFVLMGLPWFFLDDWSRVRRFAACVVGTAAIGWISFLVHPTACLRPAPDGQPVIYQALLALDRPDNCWPCLHSAFSVLAAGALMLGCGRCRARPVRFFLLAWVVVISGSIVALRQHTDADMVAGCFLGLAATWVFARSPRSQPAAEAVGYSVR